LNTASEYDGSDSGARPDEAVSWGKIKADASPVKVNIYTFAIVQLINLFYLSRFMVMQHLFFHF